MPGIAPARADARVWCRPRQEAGLIMRIAATAASRPPGARPSGPAAEPAGAAEATASEGRTTRPAIPRGDPANACLIAAAREYRRGQWPAIYRGTGPSPTAPSNARPRLLICPAGGRAPVIDAPPRRPRQAAMTASSPLSFSYLGRRKGRGRSPFAGPLLATAQARDLPGQAPGPPTP